MTPPRLTVLPGRAGRIWLLRRLETARRGADLLDRKLRVLQAELARRQSAAAVAAADWVRGQAEAGAWLLRAALLGGERALRLADDGQPAELQISYETAIGVRYPARAECSFAPPGTWDGPVMTGARQAHRTALAAAARHAAASAAASLIEDEVRTTRYRLRAVQDRWIPGLEQALAEVSFAIEEQERADAARLRLARSPATEPGVRREELAEG